MPHIRADIHPTSVLNFQALQTEWFEFLHDDHKQHALDLWGVGGVLATKAVLTVDAPNDLFSLAVSRDGWTGMGYRLELDTTEASWTDVPFADSGATVYHVAARWNEYPAGPCAGIDGGPLFCQQVQGMGEQDAPDSVTDTGSALEFTIDGLVSPVWTVADTRPVTIWLVAQETSSAEAVWTGTCALSGGAIKATVPHYFGQSSPSTTAGDYLVQVHGPTVGTVDTSADADYLYLGTITSGVFDNSNQNLLEPVGSWIAAYNVEHDGATGVHTDAHGDSLWAWDGVSVDKVGLLPTNNGVLSYPLSPAATPGLIDVRDAGGNPTLEIKDGGGTNPVLVRIPGPLEFTEHASGTPWIQVDDAADKTIQVRNIGAGAGNFSVDDGYAKANDFLWNAVQAWTSSIPAFLGVTAGGTSAISAPTNPYIESGGPPAATILISMSDLWKEAEYEVLRIKGFTLTHWRATAGDAITCRVVRKLRDGSGAAAVAGTQMTASQTPGASWEVQAEVFTHTVDDLYLYWLEIVLDAAATGSNVRALNVDVDFDALYVL
jgi:hypothetical protein